MADRLVRARRHDDFDALVELDLASARHHASIDPGSYLVPDRQVVAAFLQRRLADANREILANDGALRFYHRLGYREHGLLLSRSLPRDR
jgi:hypothetical protein